MSAYVDTSALIAALDKSDSHHSLFAGLFSDPDRLITSSLVVAEGYAWFLKRYDRGKALQFLEFIEDLKVLTIESVGPEEIRGGSELIRKFSDQNLTLADSAGLWLMQRLKIKSCWSTDFHLGLAGVPLIIHEK